MSSVEPALTAYPRTEASLRRELSSAPIHIASLQRLLRRCDLARCKGMCCYDGIYLSAEEATVISDLAMREARFFEDLGLSLPERVVVEGAWENLVSGMKTAVVGWSGSALVEGFPEHFRDTACVFHLRDGRCGL
jgi:hypothetical protein